MEIKQEQIKNEKVETVVDATAPDLVKTNKVEVKSDLELRQNEYAKNFAQFKNMTPENLKRNNVFNDLAMKALNVELSNLPTSKYLVQKFVPSPNDSIYDQTINRIFSDFEFIDAGQGAEYILTNGLVVNTMDENAFVPEYRSDIDNYTFVDSITLPNEISKVSLSIAPWKYIKYFLSGKVDEYAAMVREQLEKTLKLKKNVDAFKLLKTIFAVTYAKPSSTPDAPTNHLVGTAGNTIDALQELKNFIFLMLNHNNQFQYSADFTAKGYNNANSDDLVKITTIENYNNMIKLATTFLNDKQLLAFAEESSWVFLPKTIYDPSASTPEPTPSLYGKLSNLDILVDETGRQIPGVVFAVSRSSLKRLFNLEANFVEFYPNNMTTQAWLFSRYTQDILKWGNVAVYNNPRMENAFSLPVNQVATPSNLTGLDQEPIISKKGKK